MKPCGIRAINGDFVFLCLKNMKKEQNNGGFSLCSSSLKKKTKKRANNRGFSFDFFFSLN